MGHVGFETILKDCIEKPTKKSEKEMEQIRKEVEKRPSATLITLLATAKKI